jgi:hypothetical protein
MVSLTHAPARLQTEAFSPSATSPEFLKLVPISDGWALVRSAGDVVFDALGTDARRQCLEFAQDRGALALLS